MNKKIIEVEKGEKLILKHKGSSRSFEVTVDIYDDLCLVVKGRDE